MSSITIGKSVSTIYDFAFGGSNNTATDLIWNAQNCEYAGDHEFSNIERLTIGNEVIALPENFVLSSKITSVTIPNSVTSIGANAFGGCESLKSVSIGNSVTIINESAFMGCKSLTNVTIPQSVDFIGFGTFQDCIGLTNLECHPTTPPDAEDIFYDRFFYNQTTLFVPAEAIDAYRTHDEWGKFTHIVPFIGAGPGDINGDGNIAISDVTGLIDLLLNSEEVPAWADVDGNGEVTIKDVTTLIDKLLSNN